MLFLTHYNTTADPLEACFKIYASTYIRQEGYGGLRYLAFGLVFRRTITYYRLELSSWAWLKQTDIELTMILAVLLTCVKTETD